MKKIIFILPLKVTFKDIAFYLNIDNFFLGKQVMHYTNFKDFEAECPKNEQYLIITDSMIPPMDDRDRIKGLNMLIEWHQSNKATSTLILYSTLFSVEEDKINLQHFKTFINFLRTDAIEDLIVAIKEHY
jgi:hypothetical protein